MSEAEDIENTATGGEGGSWPVHWIVEVRDQAGTERFAAEIAQVLKGGDLVTLGGGLGVGKTTFARALIRSLCNDMRLEVPSPTFTLIQTYDSVRFPIVHADLYRIGGPDELDSLGWNETSEDALVLVEWAEKAGAPLAPDRLDIAFSLSRDNSEGRVITLTGHGIFADRLSLAKNIHGLLRRSGYLDARRVHIQGDASTRAYERLIPPDNAAESAILMIAPKRPDGPPVRNGKPYSQIAKLAEDVRPFVALARGLKERGFSAPALFGVDLSAGLLVIEDLGQDGVAIEGTPIEDRYAEAAAVLARLHQIDLPEELPVSDDIQHRIPRYDLEAMLMETELLLDWYLPHAGLHAVSVSARVAFTDLWSRTLTPILTGPQTWTLRDYHSPNLMWLEGRTGTDRVGLLDFQDCVLGPPAYDVVSLLQDARLDVPDDMEIRLLSHYARLRKKADTSFDTSAFAKAYSIMGAQRATKIMGIFARLNARDGKPQYLKHLPRIERNVRRCLMHPGLADLRGWYETHIPGLFG